MCFICFGWYVRSLLVILIHMLCCNANVVMHACS
jgi:hypothetical protein